MVNHEYKIKANDIKVDTDKTSAISLISYEIENANCHGLKKNKINEQIESLKEYGKFPINLEYVNSHTDLYTGTTASAFKNRDTGKVIVGMTGTNLQYNAIQDIGADFNIALYSVTDVDPHFKSTQDFIKDLKKDYDIDTITGHSLGGRDAMILGMSNDIDHIITYNTAPISVESTRALKPSLFTTEFFNDVRINKMIKNYNGKITHFISDEDELNNWVNKSIHVLPGKRFLIPNGKGHSMTGFLGEFEQMFITNNLKKLNKFEDAMKKSFKKNNTVTKDRLKKIDEIRSSMMMQNGGGALGSSQQKLLEYVTALAIVKGLSQQLTDDIEQLNKMYDEMKALFEKNWEEAQESGHTIGTRLSSTEVLDALYAGGVYEHKMVTTPSQIISNKLLMLNNVASQYHTFILKVEMSINEIVENDQVLASQIGELL